MSLFRRRETPRDDRARTDRFLDSLDRASEQGADLGPLEDVILAAAGAEVTQPYPPPGHGYPRR